MLGRVSQRFMAKIMGRRLTPVRQTAYDDIFAGIQGQEKQDAIREMGDRLTAIHNSTIFEHGRVTNDSAMLGRYLELAHEEIAATIRRIGEISEQGREDNTTRQRDKETLLHFQQELDGDIFASYQRKVRKQEPMSLFTWNHPMNLQFSRVRRGADGKKKQSPWCFFMEAVDSRDDPLQDGDKIQVKKTIIKHLGRSDPIGEFTYHKKGEEVSFNFTLRETGNKKKTVRSQDFLRAARAIVELVEEMFTRDPSSLGKSVTLEGLSAAARLHAYHDLQGLRIRIELSKQEQDLFEKIASGDASLRDEKIQDQLKQLGFTHQTSRLLRTNDLHQGKETSRGGGVIEFDMDTAKEYLKFYKECKDLREKEERRSKAEQGVEVKMEQPPAEGSEELHESVAPPVSA